MTMKGFRYLLPVVLASATCWWACDSRSLSQGAASGNDSQPVADVELSLFHTDINYSQSTRTAIADTIDVLVLDANRAALRDVPVQCGVESSFGGAVSPLTANKTGDTGVARFLFTVQQSDQAFSGDQTVTFTATAQGKSGQAQLQLHEESDIQLSFLSPLDGSTIYRMDDPAETMPVQVYAYRDVVAGETTQRIGVEGILINFGVAVVGEGIPGTVSAQGITNSGGVTSGVFYANAFEQPIDTVQVEFSASIASSEISTHSSVHLLNDLGFVLTRILPQDPALQGDMLCADSTRFVYQYRDQVGGVVAGARFDILPSLGALINAENYSMVTTESGILDFSWRYCEANEGELLMNLVGPSNRTFSYAYPVAAARPINLQITSPVEGSQLEIDSECLEENVTPVRATLRYTDNGNPIVGHAIHFAASHGQITSSVVTDANGVASASWHDCNETDAGSDLILTAILSLGGAQPVLSSTQTYPLDLPLGVPHHINIGSLFDVLPDPSGGALSTAVTADVFNSQNQPLGSGLAIGFKTNGIGIITQNSFTDEAGSALANYTLNGQTGVAQVHAFYARPNTAPAETLFSAPTLITVNSGAPANITLTTATPRIQILGYGSASVAQVLGRVVDTQGATVTIPTSVRFVVETAPDGVFLSLPGFEDQYFAGDTLTTQTVDGIAAMSINAGRRPGVVQIGAFVDGETYHVYSNAALVSIIAGPPAYGTIDYDGVGEAPGAGIWRVRWSVHLWDQYSNDVEDSTAVYFFLDPPNVCSMEGFGLIGIDADDSESIPGVAEDWMTYHCSNIGDTLNTIGACSAGVVMEVNGLDTLWVPGDVCIYYTDPDDPADFWQLPFQAGDRDDNLTVVGEFSQAPFNMTPCGNDQTVEMGVRATLIDGYGCAVKNQQIQFWTDIGGTYLDPGALVVTNNQGVAETVLQLSSTVLQNLGAECPDSGNGCWTYGTFTLNYGASRLPDGNPQSNEANVILSRPCD
jgi:hypothetical protein